MAETKEGYTVEIKVSGKDQVVKGLKELGQGARTAASDFEKLNAVQSANTSTTRTATMSVTAYTAALRPLTAGTADYNRVTAQMIQQGLTVNVIDGQIVSIMNMKTGAIARTAAGLAILERQQQKTTTSTIQLTAAEQKASTQSQLSASMGLMYYETLVKIMRLQQQSKSTIGMGEALTGKTIAESHKAFLGMPIEEMMREQKEVTNLLAAYQRVGVVKEKITDASKAAAKAAKEEADATNAVMTAHKKAVAPTEELGQKLRILQSRNVSNKEILQQYGPEILAAAKAQLQFSNAIDPTVAGLLPMAQAMKKAQEEGMKAASMFQRIKETALGFAAAFGGMQIVQFVSHWVRVLINFEEEWARTAIVINGTQQDIANIRQAFLQLDGSLGKTTDLLRGFTLLLKSGFSANAALELTKLGGMLAKVTGAGAVENIELLRSTMKAFNVEIGDAAKTANSLWNIMRRAGDLGPGSLQYGMAMLGPVAAGLGIKLDDLGKLISAMAGSGMSGMRAMMALQMMLGNLADSSSHTSKVLQTMGIVINEDTIRSRGFTAVMQEMGKAVAGSTEMAKIMGFQGRQLGAIMQVLKMAAEGTTESFGDLERDFEAVQQTLGDQWTDLINNFQRGILLIGDLLGESAGAFMAFVRTVNEGVVSLIENFSNFGVINKFTGAILGLAAAFAILNFTVVITGITTLVSTISGLIGWLTARGVGAMAKFGLETAATGGRMALLVEVAARIPPLLATIITFAARLGIYFAAAQVAMSFFNKETADGEAPIERMSNALGRLLNKLISIPGALADSARNAGKTPQQIGEGQIERMIANRPLTEFQKAQQGPQTASEWAHAVLHPFTTGKFYEDVSGGFADVLSGAFSYGIDRCMGDLENSEKDRRVIEDGFGRFLAGVTITVPPEMLEPLTKELRRLADLPIPDKLIEWNKQIAAINETGYRAAPEQLAAVTVAMNALGRGAKLSAAELKDAEAAMADMTTESEKFAAMNKRLEEFAKRGFKLEGPSLKDIIDWQVAALDAYKKVGEEQQKLVVQLKWLDAAHASNRVQMRILAPQIVQVVEKMQDEGVAVDALLLSHYGLAKGFVESTERHKQWREELKKSVKDLEELNRLMQHPTEAMQAGGVDQTSFMQAAESIVSRRLKEGELKDSQKGTGLKEAFVEIRKAYSDIIEVQQKFWDSGYTPEQVKRIRDVVAAWLLDTNQSKDLAEAYKEANGWMTRNEKTLRSLQPAIQGNADAALQLANAFEKLGVKIPTSSKELDDFAVQVDAVMNSVLASPQMIAEAMSALTAKAVGSWQTLPAKYTDLLEQLAFGQNRLMAERMMPDWIKYTEMVVSQTGTLPPRHMAMLIQIMQGTEQWRKDLIKPIWDKLFKDDIPAAVNMLPALVKLGMKAAVDEVSRAAKEAVDNWRKLPPAMEQTLEDGAFGLNRAVSSLLLPEWVKYTQQVMDQLGFIPKDHYAMLVDVMLNGEQWRREMMKPLWDRVVTDARDSMGKLDPELRKLNDKIEDSMAKASGKVREIWKDQVSTIVTDFSKGVADIIFEGKGMAETLGNIFKEFGKMVVRTLIEAMLDPVKKLLKQIVDSIFDMVNKGKGKGGGLKVGVDTTGIGAATTQLSTAATAITTSATESTVSLTGAATALTTSATESSTALTAAAVALTGAATALGASGVTNTAGQALGKIASNVRGLDDLQPRGIDVGDLPAVNQEIPDVLMNTGWMDKLKGAFGKGGIGTGIAGGVATGAGSSLFMQGFKSHGVKGWAQTVGGGAIAGAGIGLMIGSVLGPVGAAIGAAIGAIVGTIVGVIAKSIQTLVRAIKGKSTEYAGAMEVTRDLGGIKIGEDAFKQYYQNLGLNKDTASGIRKDITMGPKFLVEIAGPAAQAQGKLEDFLKSLEKVETAWGTFNFRQEYELGELTGNWQALDDAYVKAFKDSDVLNKNLPDWRSKLLMMGDAVKEAAKGFEDLYVEWGKSGEYGQALVDYLEKNVELLDEAAKKSKLFAQQLDAARAAAVKFKELKPLIDGFTGLKDAITNASPPMLNMYDLFLNTGTITKGLRDRIQQYGGELAAFESYSKIVKLNQEFADMCDYFRQTGIILPELRKKIQDAGGDLSKLDAAAKLPNLMQSLTNMQDFAQGLMDILPNVSGLQDVLNGTWGSDTWQKLVDEGLDPTKFTKMTDLIKMEREWDQSIQNFLGGQRMKKGDSLTQAISQFGGPEGARALDLYFNKGQNVISADLLNKVKTGMDAAYRSEREQVLNYLSAVQKTTIEEIGTLTAGVEDQISIVSLDMIEAYNAARDDIVDVLNLILKALQGEIQTAGTAAITGTGRTGTGTGAGTGLRYYNEQGGAYTNESYSYWRNATEAQWYMGNKTTGGITPIDQPPWMTDATDSVGTRGGRQYGDQFRQYQMGGRVDQTGLAVVHRGEYVVPAESVVALGGSNRVAQITSQTGSYNPRSAPSSPLTGWVDSRALLRAGVGSTDYAGRSGFDAVVPQNGTSGGGGAYTPAKPNDSVARGPDSSHVWQATPDTIKIYEGGPGGTPQPKTTADSVGRKPYAGATNYVPAMDRGGIVMTTGAAIVHAGESVVQADQVKKIREEIEKLKVLSIAGALPQSADTADPGRPITYPEKPDGAPAPIIVTPKPSVGGNSGAGTVVTTMRGESANIELHFHMEGANIMVPDIQRVIAKAWVEVADRGGFKDFNVKKVH